MSLGLEVPRTTSIDTSIFLQELWCITGITGGGRAGTGGAVVATLLTHLILRIKSILASGDTL
jgi:hypothetical protein